MRYLTIFFILFSLAVNGQNRELDDLQFKLKNNVQFELGGHGLFYSFNYERVILNGSRFKTTIQAGAGYYPPVTNVIELWAPLMLNELYSFSNHHMELGFGYVFTNETHATIVDGKFKKRLDGFFAARLGYRYQNPDNRWLFRAGFTPFLEPHGKQIYFYPSGGLAVGYSF